MIGFSRRYLFHCSPPILFAVVPWVLLPTIFLLLDCAGQFPPDGGPPDTTPPAVIRTVPDTNAIRVTENRVEIEFSEYVDRRTVEESIFISPPVGALDFDWSSTEVAIDFEDTLRKNTTYVLTIGTDVIDKRASIRMASGFTLAFSTGDSIDRGAISGRVFDAKPEGIMIFVYALRDIDPDTLNPATLRPDYVMQTGKEGKFTVSNVAWGRYRLFAIRDEYRNLVYDRQVDFYGVASSEFSLSDDLPHAGQVWLRMAREDTTKPFLTEVMQVSSSRFHARFSEPVDSLSFASASLVLSDTLEGVRQEISVRYLSEPATGMLLIAADLDSGKAYRLSVEGIVDTAGNLIDPKNSTASFVATTVPDTVGPTLRVTGLADTLIGYRPALPFEVRFSEPVNQSSTAGGISLLNSKDEAIDARLTWASPVRLLVQPADPAVAGPTLHFKAVMDSVRDLAGNVLQDSVLKISIPLFDLKKTGEVEGMLADRDASGQGVIYLTATNLGRVWKKAEILGGPGKFTMDGLPEGRYMLSAFRDVDSSGAYSPGLPFPFHASERFVVGSDTIKVRARWAVEGIRLTIP